MRKSCNSSHCSLTRATARHVAICLWCMWVCGEQKNVFNNINSKLKVKERIKTNQTILNHCFRNWTVSNPHYRYYFKKIKTLQKFKKQFPSQKPPASNKHFRLHHRLCRYYSRLPGNPGPGSSSCTAPLRAIVRVDREGGWTPSRGFPVLIWKPPAA